MDSCFLKKDGASMLEVMVVLLFVTVLLSVVVSNYTGRINKANYEKTVNELNAIAQASIDYFLVEGNWPAINQLTPQYLPCSITSSSFGGNYQIVGMVNLVKVSTLIPTGIAPKNTLDRLSVVVRQDGKDKIEISQALPNGFTSRLSYDLKHIY